MKRILIFVLGLSHVGIMFAQEAKQALPDPHAWSVRTYRFPANELRRGFVTRERGQLHAPEMPPVTATPEQIRKFIESSNDVFLQFLRLQGIPFYKGSLAIVDVKHDILVVRTLNTTHELIESLAKSYLDTVPAYISFNTHIVEAESSVIHQIVKEAPLKADQKALWDRLAAMADQGRARHIGSLMYDTRSGQRATLERAANRQYAEGFSLDGNEALDVPMSSRKVGTRLEIDPVIGPDGATLDVNYALEHDFLQPTERWEPAAQSGQRRIETQVTDFHVAKLSTAITLLSGMTKLLGVWDPDPSPAGGKVMQAAFLKGEVVHVLPVADSRAEQMMRTHGEAILPTPPPLRVQAEEGLPSGMILKRFRLPPDFLTAAGGAAPAAPADPFSSPTPPPDEPRAMRSVTALDVLKINGVAFPEGSSANFNGRTGELIVRNLPENMRKLEGFVDELQRKTPQVLGFAVHVVQAEGSLMRRLATEMSSVADHTASWETLEDAVRDGKASILRAAWLETRSGQRCTVEVGTHSMHAGAPMLGSMQETGTAQGKVRVPERLLTVEHKTEQVGFGFEIDPVIGPDGETVDINLNVKYDMAAPSARFAPAVAANKVLRVESPATDFHKAEVTTAQTMKSGAIRMMGLWKPEGNEVLEQADVLQAAFIKVDLIKVEAEGK